MTIKAQSLYEQLEKDFIIPQMSDDWARFMDSVSEYLCQNFIDRSMGLVCDFADEISKVYSAVFPSDTVLQKIIDDDIHNAMLFVHHPSIWDIRKAPEIFYQMNKTLLDKLKEWKVSIYNLHVPLDNYGEYSTSVNFAKALGIEPQRTFAPYFGGMAGVFGNTKMKSASELKNVFEEKVGHSVAFYNYGDDEIRNNTVAVIAGGGLSEGIKEIVQNNVNVFVTGITVKNQYSVEAHKIAEENRINVLGGTHYSTEKFACITMVDYFKKLRLPSEFIEDMPVLEDM